MSRFVCLAADLLPHIGAWTEEPGIHFAVAYHKRKTRPTRSADRLGRPKPPQVQ